MDKPKGTWVKPAYRVTIRVEREELPYQRTDTFLEAMELSIKAAMKHQDYRFYVRPILNS